MSTVKISVIIPTYNRLASLQRVLAGLERQTIQHSDFEVIVVSDGSTDGTDQTLTQTSTPLQLVMCSQKNGGAASARNAGIKQAQGELILFLDDDVVPEPRLIEEHLLSHSQHGKQVVVIGPMLTPTDGGLSPWVMWEQKMLEKQYTAMLNGEYAPTSRQFYTGNSSVARQHILKAGGFNATYLRAEDVELAYRLEKMGLCFSYNPRAAGYHYAKRSYASWYAIPYAYGKNDILFSNREDVQWLLPTIMGEFTRRHSLIQGLVRCCLERNTLSQITMSILRQIGVMAYRLNRMALSNMAFSSIFNLRYYQGVADALGGRAIFFRTLDNHSST